MEKPRPKNVLPWNETAFEINSFNFEFSEISKLDDGGRLMLSQMEEEAEMTDAVRSGTEEDAYFVVVRWLLDVMGLINWDFCQRSREKDANATA